MVGYHVVVQTSSYANGSSTSKLVWSTESDVTRFRTIHRANEILAIYVRDNPKLFGLTSENPEITATVIGRRFQVQVEHPANANNPHLPEHPDWGRLVRVDLRVVLRRRPGTVADDGPEYVDETIIPPADREGPTIIYRRNSIDISEVSSSSNSDDKAFELKALISALEEHIEDFDPGDSRLSQDKLDKYGIPLKVEEMKEELKAAIEVAKHRLATLKEK